MIPKSWRKHWQKKYKGCQILETGETASCYLDGELMVSVAKNGAGAIVCTQKKTDAKHGLCLDPLGVGECENGRPLSDSEYSRRVEARKKSKEPMPQGFEEPSEEE